MTGLILTILIAGVIYWAIASIPGIDGTFKQIAKILLVVFALFTIIAFFTGRHLIPGV